jgi:prepilin-type N-terminal cleavage/methylation domain-containing protein
MMINRRTLFNHLARSRFSSRKMKTYGAVIGILPQSLRGNKGFTIVELLAVLVILGVIAGIAVPKVSQTIQNSKVKACEANLDLITQAIERYGMDHIDATTGQPDYSGIDENDWDELIPDYFDVKNKSEGKPTCQVDGEVYSLSDGGLNTMPEVTCNGH